MEGFRNVVDLCHFSDLGYSGLPFTWDNRQGGSSNVKVRLDQALGDEEFLKAFDATSVRHVQTTELDHCALLISVASTSVGGNRGLVKPF